MKEFLVFGKKLKILKQEKTQLKYYVAVTLTTFLYGNKSCTIKARDINRSVGRDRMLKNR